MPLPLAAPLGFVPLFSVGRARSGHRLFPPALAPQAGRTSPGHTCGCSRQRSPSGRRCQWRDRLPGTAQIACYRLLWASCSCRSALSIDQPFPTFFRHKVRGPDQCAGVWSRYLSREGRVLCGTVDSRGFPRGGLGILLRMILTGIGSLPVGPPIFCAGYMSRILASSFVASSCGL